jgi:hypothetical protein
VKTKPGACAQENIKNEEWSQYVIENKWSHKRQNVLSQHVHEIEELISLSIYC